MALDLAILGTHGQPEMEVAIGADVHVRLVELAARLNLPLLLRLNDYYEDADFTPQEVSVLRAEVRAALLSADETLREILKEVDALLAEAEQRGVGVRAIAD